jgi:hypothetical protein
VCFAADKNMQRFGDAQGNMLVRCSCPLNCFYGGDKGVRALSITFVPTSLFIYFDLYIQCFQQDNNSVYDFTAL